MIITCDQAVAEAVKLGIKPQYLQWLDDDVYLPELNAGMRWVENDLGASVAKVIFSLFGGLQNAFIPERFDCDNFSLLAMSIAQMCWAKTNGAPEAGLLYGLFGFSTQAHAITFMGLHDGPRVVYRFFEPQPSVRGESALALTCLNEDHLTPEDIASCVASWCC